MFFGVDSLAYRDMPKFSSMLPRMQSIFWSVNTFVNPSCLHSIPKQRTFNYKVWIWQPSQEITKVWHIHINREICFYREFSGKASISHSIKNKTIDIHLSYNSPSVCLSLPLSLSCFCFQPTASQTAWIVFTACEQLYLSLRCPELPEQITQPAPFVPVPQMAKSQHPKNHHLE